MRLLRVRKYWSLLSGTKCSHFAPSELILIAKCFWRNKNVCDDQNKTEKHKSYAFTISVSQHQTPISCRNRNSITYTAHATYIYIHYCRYPFFRSFVNERLFGNAHTIFTSNMVDVVLPIVLLHLLCCF